MPIERDNLGRFIPAALPEGTFGPNAGKEVGINDLIRKYGFGIAESTCCAEVDYDLETSTMTVAFKQRGTYEYSNVPLEEYFNFQQASSRGTYFNLYVRTRYQYRRIA